MSDTVRLVDGAAGADTWPSGLYPGRWLWHVDPFTIAAGGDGDVNEFDMVIEDPADPTYVFDIYGGWDSPQPASIITGGFDFDSAAPTIFDWWGVWRVTKTTYEGWGYTYPNGGAYDGTWAGPFAVDETLSLLEGPPALPAPDLSGLPNPERAINVEVYDPDGWTLRGVLTSDSKRTFRDAGKEPGSFSFELKSGTSDETMCEDDCIVRFVVDGTRRFTGIVEKLTKVAADPNNRKAGQVITVTGRDAIVILDDGVVYPALGLGVVSPDTRYFNFASRNYVEDTWGDATEVKQQNVAGDPYDNAPIDWDDPDAYWISDEFSGTPPTHEFELAFRSPVFTVPSGEGGDYRFEYSADDGARVWVDEYKRADEIAAGLWGESRYFDVTLDEGDHQVAVMLVNLERPDPDLNIAAFILTCRKILAGGQSFGDPILRTDGTWRRRAYTSPAPGFTPGQILRTVIGEEQTAGGLASLAVDFTDEKDSAGVDWPDKVDVAFRVSSSLLDVAYHLVEEGLCDIALDPDGMTLHAWVKRGDDTPTTTIAVADNVGALAHEKKRAGKNTAIVQTAEGRWLEVASSSHVTTYGRKVGGADFGSAPSTPAGQRMAEAWFRDQAGQNENIRDLRVEGPGYPELTPCNLVTAEAYDGTSADRRVLAVALSEDDAGNPIYTPELQEDDAA